MSTVLVIPARYASTRLPGKPLRLLNGKPLIQHVHERAMESGIGQVVIATDDQRIEDVCLSFGAEVCMTSSEHETGSDRLSEVVAKYGWSNDTVVVNLQGDEPLTPIANLKQVAENLQQHPEAQIATLATPLDSDEEYHDPNVVKVVPDINGLALYFSRANIPFLRENNEAPVDFALRHLGIYAYRASYLKAFAEMDVCPLEEREKLEQLRAMYYGHRIHVDIAKEACGHGVDTEADIAKVEAMLQSR